MKNNFYFLIILNILLIGCVKDVDKSSMINENDIVPSLITNVQVENVVGGAILTYDLPPGDNLLYILAEYELKNNKKVEKKASYFDNQLKLEGFGESKEYTVKVYSVSRGGKKSEPLSVKINPLTPQIQTTFESLEIIPTFGGLKIGFENLSETDLRIYVITADSVGDLYTPETFYTKRKTAQLSVRGFEDTERSFGVYIADRWDNTSDTLYTTLTPWFEEEFDKTKFRVLDLPTDRNVMHAGQGPQQVLWDGKFGTGVAWHTAPNTGIPQWFTLDLGVKGRFSRVRMHSRGNKPPATDGAYYAGDPETFEIYGSNDPAADGSWDSWTLMGKFVSIKPSGEAKPTDEDFEFAAIRGQDFEFESDAPFRYIRFKTTKVWGGVTYVYISELTFFGQMI